MLGYLISFALALAPQADVVLAMDCESLEGGHMPSEWQVDGIGLEAGYRARVTNEGVYGGEYCIELHYDGTTEPVEFGKLFNRLDAASLRGKRVALRAMVRVGPGSTARLMLRGISKEGRASLLAGHVHEPLRGNEWQAYEVVGDVGGDVAQLEVGFGHQGRAAVLVDDIRLVVLGDRPELELLPPSMLGESARMNLSALGRLVGYLRYYHPSDQAAEADWGALTRAAVLAVEDADGTLETCERLEAFFAPVAPSLRVFTKGRQPGRRSDWVEPPDDGGEHWIVRWQHRGIGTSPSLELGSERLREEFTGRIPRGFSKPHKAKDYDLGDYMYARMPTSLFADAGGTLPHTDAILAEGAVPIEAAAALSGNDRATRIATVILAWNAVQHFSPLLEEAEVDWTGALRTAIASASEARDERELLTTLREMLAVLPDGQARVDHISDWRDSHVPICWDVVEDQLVVTHIPTDERASIGVGPGDVVLKIAGTPALDAIAEASARFGGATEQRKRIRALESLLQYAFGANVSLHVKSTQGHRMPISYVDPVARPRMRVPKPAPFSEVASGVRYVDLSMLREPRVDEMLEAVADAKTVVFDLRGGLQELSYRRILSHLVSKPTDDVEWSVPISDRPNREKLEWDEIEAKITPAEPHIDAELVFLVDGSVVGDAEALAAVARAASLGPLVGSTTGGTTGAVTAIELPGGYHLQWTAVRAKGPKGVEVQGTGIEPDHHAEPTLSTVKAGRDAALAKAIE